MSDLAVSLLGLFEKQRKINNTTKKMIDLLSKRIDLQEERIKELETLVIKRELGES